MQIRKVDKNKNKIKFWRKSFKIKSEKWQKWSFVAEENRYFVKVKIGHMNNDSRCVKMIKFRSGSGVKV